MFTAISAPIIMIKSLVVFYIFFQNVFSNPTMGTFFVALPQVQSALQGCLWQASEQAREDGLMVEGGYRKNRPRPGQAAIVLFVLLGSPPCLPPALFSLIFSSDSLFSSQGFQCCRGVCAAAHAYTQQEGCNAGRSCKNCCWLSFFLSRVTRLKNGSPSTYLPRKVQ
jgi:hypothetical protein